MKPIITITLNLPELNKYAKYRDTEEVREYLHNFLDDCLIVVRTAKEQGVVLDDVSVFNDKNLLR